MLDPTPPKTPALLDQRSGRTDATEWISPLLLCKVKTPRPSSRVYKAEEEAVHKASFGSDTSREEIERASPKVERETGEPLCNNDCRETNSNSTIEGKGVGVNRGFRCIGKSRSTANYCQSLVRLRIKKCAVQNARAKRIYTTEVRRECSIVFLFSL